MFSQNSNFSLSILSKIINEPIDYYTTCKKKRSKDELEKIKEITKKENEINKNSPFKTTRTKTKRSKTKFVDEILFICKESIVFIGQNLKEKEKRKIPFKNIALIRIKLTEIDNKVRPEVTFELNHEIKSKLRFTFVIKNVINFLQILNGKYKIYCVNRGLKFKDIPIEFSNKNSDDFLDDFTYQLPDGYKIEYIKGYKFYINTGFIKSNTEPFTYELKISENKFYFLNKNNKSKSKISHKSIISEDEILTEEENESKEEEEEENKKKTPTIWITVYINNEKAIETLNSDNSILNYPAFEALNLYLNKNFEGLDYFIKNVKEIDKELYIPDEDNLSEWKCFLFNVKIKPKNGIGYNVAFYYIRRIFIPPFFESYNDIILVCKEEYFINNNNNNNNEINIKEKEDKIKLRKESYKKKSFISVNNFDNSYNKNEKKDNDSSDFTQNAKNCIEEVFTSLTPIQIDEVSTVCDLIIDKKFDAYLMDKESINFFYGTIGLFGKESYKLAMDYKTKLALFYNEYDKNVDFFFDDEIITAYNADNYNTSEDDFDLNKYKKNLKQTSFEKIVEKYLKDLKKYFEIVDNQTEIFYKFKIANFIGNVILNEVFMDKFFSNFLNLINRDMEFKNELKPVLNYLLNLMYINRKNEILLNTNISEIISNSNDIFQISFNEQLMIILIEKNLLKEVQNIESDLIYIQFLNLILNKKFSINLLSAIYNVFQYNEKSNFEFEEDDLNTNNPTNKTKNSGNFLKNYSILVPTFVKLFTDSNQNPVTTILSCKCLIILSNKFSNIKEDLCKDEFFEYLYNYFSSSNQEILLNSITLFSQIVTKKNDFRKLIQKHEGYIIKLINIIKGTGIPGCIYKPELIIFVLNYFNKILNDIYIMEFLTGKKLKKLIKYLFIYIDDIYKVIGYDMDLSFEIEIMTCVYELLYKIILNNNYYKKYIETNFNFIRIFNEKCNDYTDYIINYDIDNDIMRDFMKSIIKFLDTFFGNDLLLIKSAKMIGKNIVHFIEIIVKFFKKKENLYFDNKDININQKWIDECNEVIKKLSD